MVIFLDAGRPFGESLQRKVGANDVGGGKILKMGMLGPQSIRQATHFLSAVQNHVEILGLILAEVAELHN